MSAATTERPRRLVRLVLDGEVTATHNNGEVLRVRVGDETGPLLLVNREWPGVTVEDVTPAHRWTDGDVIVHRRDVWVRSDGEWHPAGRRDLRLSDAVADRTLAARPEATMVLRCQADDSTGVGG